MTVRIGPLSLDWYGYATIRIGGPENTIYLDPGRYGVLSGEWAADTPTQERHPESLDRRPEDGDVICISHIHHYDPDGIERVATNDATLVVFEGLSVHDTDRTDTRPVDLPYDLRQVGAEDEVAVNDVPIFTVPAFNAPDGPHTRSNGTPYHPEGFGCGFVIAIGGHRVFWPGDTDVLPGHTALQIDVVLPPIGGSFTMDRHEAAELVTDLGPRLAVPVHYNTFDALETDDRAFAADVAEAGVPIALDR
ncbi:MAG: MBL fold metallo-hydrolase [Salinirussus sp.]